MKTLKVFLSPSFFYDEFYEEVTGMKFRKGRGIEVTSIDVDGLDLSGIQSALRKNILLPFDNETREFAASNNLQKPVEVVVEPEPEQEVVLEAKEEVKEEDPEVKEELKKPARKKSKKDSE